jgi:diacylglycerol kinase family enzyme
MNLLTRALYGPLPWARALTDTLVAPTIRDVSAAEANGQRFFCAGVFGAPSLWADAREALRHWNLTGAAARAVTAIRRHGESLDYRFGGEPRGAAEAVVVICPLGALRAPHCDGALEAAAIGPSSAGVVLSLAFHAVFDDWRQDESISISKVSEVQISGHGRVPAILDGETMIMGREVVVSIVPRAFRAMTPATPLP